MARIRLRLDPTLLENPVTDLIIVIPDLLAERSKGLIEDDGFDYIDSPTCTYLVISLRVSQVEAALSCILHLIENERIEDNDLRPASVIVVDDNDERRVVYPPGFSGPLLIDRSGLQP